ncbi:MAG: hypothetical protein CMH93_08320, partial [Oceanicaulis sp.]|nr:hypothetical protein [Oceanicaulis sp.]
TGFYWVNDTYLIYTIAAFQIVETDFARSARTAARRQKIPARRQFGIPDTRQRGVVFKLILCVCTRKRHCHCGNASQNSPHVSPR